MSVGSATSGEVGGAGGLRSRGAEVLTSSRVAGIWVRHLCSLLLPGNALLFVWTGPHHWYVAPLFTLPLVMAFLLDDGPRVEHRQPREDLPALPFDLIAYLLAAIQLGVIVGIGHIFATQAIFSVDMVMMVVVVGGSSGFSIITAHELIHRTNTAERTLGRLLLCTVLQEHFFTEHLRGHHVRVGLPDDPATARFGETYEAFYRRTVPGQIRNAWRLEKGRLGDEGMSLFDPRMLRNRIVHGVLVGWGIGAALWLGVGFAAFVAFVVQAFMASRLLEAVNYFEHWGLSRTGSRVRPRDSWDTHAWFTYYGLVGLSRHADHHYEQIRPYQQLRVQEGVPLLPSGYVAMVDLVMGKNEEYQRLATEELRRAELGPFDPAIREETEEPIVPEASEQLETSEASVDPQSQRGWRAVPQYVRVVLLAGAAVVALSLGGLVESGTLALATLVAALLLNAWILAAFFAMFRSHRLMREQGLPEGLAWSLAMALLVVLGRATEVVGSLVS